MLEGPLTKETLGDSRHEHSHGSPPEAFGRELRHNDSFGITLGFEVVSGFPVKLLPYRREQRRS